MKCVNWILVPIDFSPSSRAALMAADDQAHLWDSGLILLHVTTDELQEVLGPANKRHTLVEWSKSLPYTSTERMAYIFSSGDPVEKILQVAEQYQARAIFMGQGGKGGSKLGSIAHQIHKKYHGRVEYFVNPAPEDATVR